MSISTDFERVVANGDLLAIKRYLINYLQRDPSGGLFDEHLHYAQDRIKVIQPHDGGKFETDQSKWSEDYYSTVRVALTDNFSLERISHLKAVVKHLYPNKVYLPDDSSSDEWLDSNVVMIAAGAIATIAGVALRSNPVSNPVVAPIVAPIAIVGGIVAACIGVYNKIKDTK